MIDLFVVLCIIAAICISWKFINESRVKRDIRETLKDDDDNWYPG